MNSKLKQKKKRTLIAFKLSCSMIIFLIPLVFFGQKTAIRGAVVDEATKATLPGVTVTLKNSTNSTISDSNGNYQINANN